MNRRLFWKLCLTVAAGTVALFAAISWLIGNAEEGMSMLDAEHQQQIIDYGAQAEHLHRKGDHEALAAWLRDIQVREGVWVAVVSSEITPLAGSVLTQRFVDGFRIGRDVSWKIHLYFSSNPIMEVPFADGHTHFLMVLPDRMRPGAYWRSMQILLQIGLPLVLLVLLSWVLYRHVVDPLRKLQQATHKFSEGDYGVRVRAGLGARNDEFTALAETFDRMAERTGQVIVTLRGLIAELSHELRTPLARLDMAVHSLQQGLEPGQSLYRIRRESAVMRGLVEDSLALAWLENERPTFSAESLDLVDLLDIVIEDAAFEFPDRRLVRHLPEQAGIEGSDHRALGQAIENILRNALRYTPVGGAVTVSLSGVGAAYRIDIADEGPGVPPGCLQAIFQPFYRVPDHPAGAGEAGEGARDSFGLGLALAWRQIKAAGGEVWAENLAPGGLRVSLQLPAGGEGKQA